MVMTLLFKLGDYILNDMYESLCISPTVLDCSKGRLCDGVNCEKIVKAARRVDMSQANEDRMNSNAGASPSGGAGPQGEELTMLTGSDGIKVILLGDSAVGKSKLVERFLQSSYKPHLLSTYALTLYKHTYKAPDGTQLAVDIWDTAGQERFNSMHASYYYRAHACIMVFDVTRKITYKNLDRWYEELQQHAKGIPTLVVANKIDIDYQVTQKSFKFAEKHGLPFFFVSASDGTNVVRIFHKAILEGVKFKLSPKDDFYQEALDLLAGLDSTAKQQQRNLIKAVLSTAELEQQEHEQQQQQQQQKQMQTHTQQAQQQPIEQ